LPSRHGGGLSWRIHRPIRRWHPQIGMTLRLKKVVREEFKSH
jgi:hypothetical protein